MPVADIIPSSTAGMTRAESAYRAIRDAILSNHLCVGEHLHEESIAQQLGISRTPIREALGRLHSERLVKEAKPRGYVVSAVTATDIFHVYAVREELEGFCLRLAAGRITPHQIFQLSTIIARMDQELGDPQHFSQLNRRFHTTIFGVTDNPVLMKIMDDLMAVVDRFPVSAYEVDGRMSEVLVEHRQILDALSRHDADAAEKAARTHLHIGLEARLIALRRHEMLGRTTE